MFVVPRQVQDVLRRSGVERPFRLVVDRQDGGRDRLTVEVEGRAPDGGEGLRSEVERALRIRVDMRFVDVIPPGSPRLVDNRAEQNP